MMPEFVVRQNSLKSVHRSIHKFNGHQQRQQRPRQSRKGTQMPAYRIISKSEASTKEAAVEFLLQDTGGAVRWDSTFPIIEDDDCFRIPAWSADGRAAMPLSVVRALATLGKDADGNDLKERPYNDSAGPHPTPDRLEELKANAANFYKMLRGE